jgi:hypothetical protein
MENIKGRETMTKKFFGVAAVLGFAAILNAQETYSTWTYHRNVFLNTSASGANVNGEVTNFPVLVRLTAKDSNTFTQALAGGIDIRFTKAGDVTRLKHQIDSWDATTKTASVWVLLDTIKGNNRTQMIRMHWGKAAVADSSNGTAVFSNGFTNVWHLGNAAGVTARPNAITGGNPATPTNFAGAYTAPAGIIGKGEYLRGGNGYTAGNPTASTQNDHFDLGSITSDYSQGFSFSVWINAETLGNNTAFFTASGAASGTATGTLVVIGGQGTDGALGAKMRQRNGTSGSNSGIINTDGALGGIVGTWSHILGTLNNTGEMTYYLNGFPIGSASGLAAYASATRPINLLGTTLAHMQYLDSSFRGTMDEARLANVGRTQDWATLEYENQKPTQSLVSFDTVPPASIGRALVAGSRQTLTARASGRSVVFQVAGIEAGNGRLSVSDMQGRTVWEGTFAPGSNRLAWDGARASAGIYMASMRWVNSQGKTTKVLQAKVPLTH